MSTRKERVLRSFDMIRSNVLSGQDARAIKMLLKLVEAETKKTLESKK